MSESIHDLLQQAWLLIQANRKDEALAIVKPICVAEPNNAEAWYTAANALDDLRLKRIALERALKADPAHDLAREELGRLDQADPVTIADDEMPAISDIVDSIVPEEPRKKPRKKAARSARRELVIVAAVVVEVAALAIVYLLFFVPKPPKPHPMLGPYYPRQAGTPINAAKPPCSQYTFLGQIQGGAGLFAHIWNDTKTLNLDLSTDSDGVFKALVPVSQLAPMRDQPDLSEIFHMRLHDAQNQPMSGIMDARVYITCTFPIQYVKYEAKDREPNTPTYMGHYVLTYSDPTESGVYICKFTGFMGSVFDDQGPVSDFEIDTWGSFQGSKGNMTTSSDAPELGPGGWALVVPPGGIYYLNILRPDGLPVDTHQIDLPATNDCKTRLIQVAITQFDQ